MKKSEICQVANRLRLEIGHELEDRLDIDLLTQLGGFKPRVSPYLSKSSIFALLIPIENNRFRIALRPNKTETAEQERRYLIAHEIAHSLAYVRIRGRRPRRGFTSQDLYYEERFCEEFARQLLIPRETVNNFSNAEELGRHFEVINQLAKLAISAKPMVHREGPNYRYAISLD